VGDRLILVAEFRRESIGGKVLVGNGSQETRDLAGAYRGGAAVELRGPVVARCTEECLARTHQVARGERVRTALGRAVGGGPPRRGPSLLVAFRNVRGGDDDFADICAGIRGVPAARRVSDLNASSLKMNSTD
jgi:hypothetical protein